MSKKSDKYESLVQYIEDYDFSDSSVLLFTKEDGRYLLEACETQVGATVKLNEHMNILYCPRCERQCRKNYDLFCSGCGKRLKY